MPLVVLDQCRFTAADSHRQGRDTGRVRPVAPVLTPGSWMKPHHPGIHHEPYCLTLSVHGVQGRASTSASSKPGQEATRGPSRDDLDTLGTDPILATKNVSFLNITMNWRVAGQNAPACWLVGGLGHAAPATRRSASEWAPKMDHQWLSKM